MRRTLKEGEIPNTSIECVHAATCAGCPLIQLDYVQQLAAKRARVVTATSHYPALELVYTRPLVPGEPITGYRGRAKLIVSPAGAIGLYGRAGNHEVVDIPGCRVLTPAVAEVAAALRRLIAAPPPAARPLLLPYDPLGGGVLRAVDLREVSLPPARPLSDPGKAPTGYERSALDPKNVGVLATFVLQRDRSPSREELYEAGRALRPLLPRVLGLAVNLHEADSPQILGPETFVLDGADRVEDRIGPTWHVATFGSFVQVHRDQAARIHTMVVREVAALDLDDPATDPNLVAQRHTPRVLDLYGGSGAISLALAHAQYDVTMVESFAPATQAARVAAEAQGLFGLDVRTGDVAEVVASLLASGDKYDAVVMNPPRRGISPLAREAIARLGPQILIYISCDPETLARDLDHLGRLGYGSSELMPLDMIPLTEEVETVSVLRRAPPPAPKVIFEDEDVLVVDKGPHEPIEAQAEYLVSLVNRCARLPGVTELKPVHRLDPGTSGLCILGKTHEAAAAWAESLTATGRLIYLAAAKGVTPAKGAITRDLREGGRAYPARTRYRRLAVASGHSILRVIPDGGRTHQIRRHLAAIGHPVLGDERYGHLPTNRYFEEKHGLDRSFVHLVRIEVAHPKSGQRMLIESTLPGDLRGALERATGSSVLRFLEQKHALGDHRTSSIPPPPLPADDMAPPSSRMSQPEIDLTPSERPTPLMPLPRGLHGQPDAEGRPPALARGPTSRPERRATPTSTPGVPGAGEEAPRSDRTSAVPELDESPRTRRHAIVSDDE